jgi:hypothetical protein
MADDALLMADRLIEAFLRSKPEGENGWLDNADLNKNPTWKAILQANPDDQAAMVTSALERLCVPIPGWKRVGPSPPAAESFDGPNPRLLVIVVLRAMLRKKQLLSEQQILALVNLAATQGQGVTSYWQILPGVVSAVERRAESERLSEPLREATRRLAEHVGKRSEFPDFRKAAIKLNAALSDSPHASLEPGEAWSDVALAALAGMPPTERRLWGELLAHCQSASGSKPTAAWQKSAEARIEAIGFIPFKRQVLLWFPPVARPRTAPVDPPQPWLPDPTHLIQPLHLDLLRGLVWCCGLFSDADLAQALAELAITSYRKLPGKGARLETLGGACIAALRAMEGTESIGPLALLKSRVKFGKAENAIEKGLAEAAERMGLRRDEIDELGVPEYGLDATGGRLEKIGEFTAELRVDSGVTLRWKKSDGQALKTTPASVKKDHSGKLKELQNSVKAIGLMLSTQRQRVDGLYLNRKSWRFDAWCQRYRDHPLIGAISRKLIWRFTTDGKTRDGVWQSGAVIGHDEVEVKGLKKNTSVTLWHPLESAVADVIAWRNWLDEHHIQQPFKQAHREVYLITDAERQTRLYSNRFAAHILRQHQFNSLCSARGWKNQLRLMVSAEYPPASRLMPAWNLNAKFWVEGAGSEFGRDTNETGTYLHLITDQVRFYPTDGPPSAADRRRAEADAEWPLREPVPLEQVPPLAFSEIMRDIDLFVGVSSVGNDPTWSDGGPNGVYRDYWQSYSFGELSATAQTRKAVLELLIPRLSIAPRCSFTNRFLIVKGDLRTYKIHLGSGNILMEPNDQYLCIIQKKSDTAPDERLFLPFEGDGTLSMILSKALLLASDKQITDRTIAAQIRR